MLCEICGSKILSTGVCSNPMCDNVVDVTGEVKATDKQVILSKQEESKDNAEFLSVRRAVNKFGNLVIGVPVLAGSRVVGENETIFFTKPDGTKGGYTGRKLFVAVAQDGVVIDDLGIILTDAQVRKIEHKLLTSSDRHIEWLDCSIDKETNRVSIINAEPVELVDRDMEEVFILSEQVYFKEV